MKKPVLVIVILLLILGLGGGAYLWYNVQKDPTDMAEGFLQQIAAQDFSGLDMRFGAEPHPTDAELKEAFRRFGQAFGLTDITLTDFSILSKESKDAVFYVAMTYESRFFESLSIATSLRMTRETIFEDWKVRWEDNLPLPTYGFEAEYARTRQEPKRGQILDPKGQVLAGEGSLVAVGVQPDRITDPETLLDALHSELGFRPDYVRRQYEAPGVQGHWFVPLANLSEAEYRRVDPILRPIPGVFFRRVDARSYPEGATMTHITGYLGEVTSNMIDAYPEREYLSGELVGRSGLEQSYDDTLRGRPGYRFFVEVNGSRTLLSEKVAIDGEHVELTIDTRMQELAHEVLGDRQGSLVVVDAQTGAILALASTPSYDANEFVGGISTSRWQELSSDERLPMFNRALQGLYPPGSVFKVVTVAAALDSGLYEAGSVFVDDGELGVQGNIVRNYQRQVFGEHTLHKALVESINTTIAQVGLDLGASTLEQYFRLFGLDQAHQLGLPMMRGQVGTPGRSRVALAWSAIGQDQVLLTPLHMAQIFSVLANGGYLPPIHLIRETEQPGGTFALKTETVAQLNSMLQDVVLQGTGTALRDAGVNVYGKTGTAEMVGGDMHAWFAGHTELPDGQRIAFSLLVEEGGVGGQTAAPLMRDYLTRLIQQ
jgi:cell division protein FtsI/penicillin-binding protein 2